MMEVVELPSPLPESFVGFNASGEESPPGQIPHPWGAVWAVTLSTVLCAIMLVAVTGNVMVILIIARHKSMRESRTNIFIANLAIADILVAVLDMPFSVLTVVRGVWVLGEAWCQVNGFTMAVFLITSIHTLMYIALHKYVAVCRPFSRFFTLGRILVAASASWLWAILCGVTLLLGWNTIVYKRGSSQCGPDYPHSLSSRTHSYFITATCYLLPLLIMAVCYTNIFRKIRKHNSRMARNSNEKAYTVMQQQKRIAKTMFMVVACFLICWTPYIIYSNVIVFRKDKTKLIPAFYGSLAYWCGYLNSACNPIIYALRSPSFRQGYLELICGKKRTSADSGNDLTIHEESPKMWRKVTGRIRDIIRSTSRSTESTVDHKVDGSRLGYTPTPPISPGRPLLGQRPRVMTSPAQLAAVSEVNSNKAARERLKLAAAIEAVTAAEVSLVRRDTTIAEEESNVFSEKSEDGNSMGDTTALPSTTGNITDDEKIQFVMSNSSAADHGADVMEVHKTDTE